MKKSAKIGMCRLIKIVIFMSIEIKERIDLRGVLAWGLVRNCWQERGYDIDMKEKGKEINKSESVKIWNKGYFGHFWGKNKKEDYFMNNMFGYDFDYMDFLEAWKKMELNSKSSRLFFIDQGLIENCKNDVVKRYFIQKIGKSKHLRRDDRMRSYEINYRDLLGWTYDKQIKIEGRNGWGNDLRFLGLIEIENKQGQFGNYPIYGKFGSWNDHYGVWWVSHSGWNIAENISSWNIEMRRQGQYGQIYVKGFNCCTFVIFFWSLAEFNKIKKRDHIKTIGLRCIRSVNLIMVKGQNWKYWIWMNSFDYEGVHTQFFYIGIDGHGIFTIFSLKNGLQLGLIPSIIWLMPYDVVHFHQYMGFILIYYEFPPWKRGVYTKGIDGFGIFLTFSLKSELHLGLIPSFIRRVSYEVDFINMHMGCIPKCCEFYPWKQGLENKGIDGRIFNHILNFFGNLLLEGSIPENSRFNPICLGLNLGSIPSDIVMWFAPFFQKWMIFTGSNPDYLVGWFFFFFHKKNLNLGSIPSSLVIWLAPFFQKRMNLSGSNPEIIVWFFNFFRKKFKNLGSNPSDLVGGFYDFIHKKSNGGNNIRNLRMNVEEDTRNGMWKNRYEQRWSIEDCKNWKIVNRDKKEDESLAFYSIILMRCIKDNKDKRVERRKKIAIVDIIESWKMDIICIFLWNTWDNFVHRPCVILNIWIWGIYRDCIFEDWKEKSRVHFKWKKKVEDHSGLWSWKRIKCIFFGYFVDRVSLWFWYLRDIWILVNFGVCPKLT
ncbi:hypothetical protein Lser_V15G31447 [Lactuca serriola]